MEETSASNHLLILSSMPVPYKRSAIHIFATMTSMAIIAEKRESPTSKISFIAA